MLTIRGMHLGEDHLYGATDDDLVFCAETGVEYVNINPPSRGNSRSEELAEDRW